MRLPIQVECIPYKRVDKTFRFLLLKRISKRGGFWQAVTGGLEDGDKNLKSACLREIKEETSLDEKDIIKFTDKIYFYQFENDEGIILSEYVYGVEVKPDVKIDIDKNVYPEHREYKWVSIEEAKKLLKWKNNKIAISKLHDDLNKK